MPLPFCIFGRMICVFRKVFTPNPLNWYFCSIIDFYSLLILEKALLLRSKKIGGYLLLSMVFTISLKSFYPLATLCAALSPLGKGRFVKYTSLKDWKANGKLKITQIFTTAE